MTPVSIHARTGRATSHGHRATTLWPWFQFTRARGARPSHGISSIAPKPFQFTRARGARRELAEPESEGGKFQFTRARGARLRRQRRRAHTVVSIHARTGRATRAVRKNSVFISFQFTRARGARPLLSLTHPMVGVSIHARTGRATPAARWWRWWRTGFNSRAHGARDSRGRLRGCFRDLVSIHARTGRATPHEPGRGQLRAVSIHARTGRATRWPWKTPPQRWFQFTRARGARRRNFPATWAGEGFNSRAHGARDVAVRPRGGRGMFQFTRARGARQVGEAVDERGPLVSIHARTGRATLLLRYGLVTSVFQFTRARGARLPSGANSLVLSLFQFTRARGARLCAPQWPPPP